MALEHRESLQERRKYICTLNEKKNIQDCLEAVLKNNPKEIARPAINPSNVYNVPMPTKK